MRSSVAAGLLAIAFSWPIVIVASGAEKGPEERGPVAATVNGTPIYASEVQEALAPLNAGRDLTAAEKTKLAAEVLERLIDRRLVEAAIRKAELAADDAQVEQALKQLRLGVEADKASWSDYLAGRSQSEASLRRQVAWQLSWQRFLQARLSDAQFEDYFKAHARDFDGTELRVSHLLHGPLPSDPSAVAALVEGARKLRERITAGTPTFEEAVKKYSTGPSREQAGDPGLHPPARCDGRSLQQSRLRFAAGRDQPARGHTLRRTPDQSHRSSPRPKAMDGRARPTQTARGASPVRRNRQARTQRGEDREGSRWRGARALMRMLRLFQQLAHFQRVVRVAAD